jgi:hypothetical protein
MKSPLPLLTDFSDRLSPMVVKEMRQGLRTRFFTAALILFHVMLGLLMLGFLMDVRAQDAHEMFWVIIIATLLGILPARAWNALHDEAKEGTLDMLVLTGISSFRIVWGKWVSLYSQTLLVVSSLLPYMIARYQLGGVEIVREIVGLYLLILGSAIITAGMVAFSSQSLMMIRLLFSALVGVVAFGFGVYVFVLTIESSGVRMWEDMMPKDLTGIVVLWSCITGLSAFLVYELLCISSARLPMMKDTQGSVKRMVAVLVLGLCTSAIWWMYWQGSSSRSPMMVFTVLFLFPSTLLVGMDVLTESSGLSTHAHLQSKSFGWLRGLFSSGWQSGVFFYTLICFLPLSAVVAAEKLSSSSTSLNQDLCRFASILVANVVPICIPIFRKESRLGQWLVCQLILVGIVIIIVSGLATMTAVSGAEWCYVTFISPLTVFFGAFEVRSEDRLSFSQLGVSVSLLWVLAAMFLAVREINRLRALAIASDSIPSSTDAELS